MNKTLSIRKLQLTNAKHTGFHGCCFDISQIHISKIIFLRNFAPSHISSIYFNGKVEWKTRKTLLYGLKYWPMIHPK